MSPKPPAIEVVTESSCHYCKRRSAARYCGNCGRVTCESCYQGLGCPRKRCHSRPQGGGVR